MNVAEVLKYGGEEPVLLWRHPVTDFASGSQLVVHEAQVALVLQNGKILGQFGPGRYSLTTQNLPGIQRVVNGLFGGASPFHCEVYFVSTAERLGLRWGTEGRVTYLDPATGIPLSLGANGAVSLRVKDPALLLRRLVGTAPVLDGHAAMESFNFFLQSRVKNYLGAYMHAGGVSIFEVDGHLTELSTALQQRLAPDFAAYGLELVQLQVMGTAKPDGEAGFERLRQTYADQFLRPKNAQIDQTVALIQADTDAEVRRRQGYTWQEEQSFAVAKELARNEGVGSFTSAGIGLGMMGGIGTAIGGAMAQVTGAAVTPAAGQSATAQKHGARQSAGTAQDHQSAAMKQAGAAPTGDAAFCVRCGQPLQPSFTFCPHCGAPKEE